MGSFILFIILFLIKGAPMYGIYTPVVLLHAYCIYHAYRNNAQRRWYWLIILFPLIGCIIYLIHAINHKARLDMIMDENIREAILANSRLEELEKAVEINDSVTNKVNLADEYVESGRYKDAISLYTSCLAGFMADDPGIRMKLLYTQFMDDNYAETVKLGDGLDGERIFRDSEERIAYAWASYHEGDVQKAERVFRDMDRSYTNYLHRLEYSKFLANTDRPEPARQKLMELLEEFDQMQETERRHNRPIHRDAKELYETLAYSG